MKYKSTVVLFFILIYLNGFVSASDFSTSVTKFCGSCCVLV